ncbi:L-lactate dehydrogenase complex protein LldG [Arcanobacterium pluranimalium]|uniref:LutC/YkgG family protein n=1 Tax=Arcanobacterium pluranimalium TaxID=108028 RepID=UPI00195EDE3B|nr:LUD domain-containing protein [Arcanobacterium pluranimalium]MBM7825520.1 L-lactate dehydrogenase complex protein LldG [Arcanobacterium pluranimalium]
MSAREDILQAVRQALSTQEVPAPEPVRNYRRSSDEAPGSEPVIADLIEKLEDYTAQVVRCKADGIADAIDSFLADTSSVVVPKNLAPEWKDAAQRNSRQLHEDSLAQPLSNDELNQIDAVVTASAVAISMSGTIILDGEPNQGRRAITLIPDTHVIVLNAKDVYPTVAQAVEILGKNPTRPFTWIAGPSATSDIELVRVDGVHGPRNLRVVIVES